MTDLVEKPSFTRCMIEGLVILVSVVGLLLALSMGEFFVRGGGWNDFYVMWSWFLRQQDKLYAFVFMFCTYTAMVLVLRFGPESEGVH